MRRGSASSEPSERPTLVRRGILMKRPVGFFGSDTCRVLLLWVDRIEWYDPAFSEHKGFGAGYNGPGLKGDMLLQPDSRVEYYSDARELKITTSDRQLVLYPHDVSNGAAASKDIYDWAVAINDVVHRDNAGRRQKLMQIFQKDGQELRVERSVVRR